MQNTTKKMIEEVSEAELQAVTGGCATCAGYSSIALEEANKAMAKATLHAGTKLGTRQASKVTRLQQIARQGLSQANQPTLEGCLHCKDAASLMTRLGKGHYYGG